MKDCTRKRGSIRISKCAWARISALLAGAFALCLLAYLLAPQQVGRAQSPSPSPSPSLYVPQPVAERPLPPDAPARPYKRLTGPETLNPGDYPAHFPYPDEYDSVAAAPEVHHLRYVDANVRFVEVAYFPGIHGQMHGHPFPSVFVVDAPTPHVYNLLLDPENAIHISSSKPPAGAQFPVCKTMNPQSPHAESNPDTFPDHFYRLEFLRVDGAGIADHWKEWCPKMLIPLFAVRDSAPAKDAKPFSVTWPWPIAYDSPAAAPNNNKLLYEDDHVRLIEVTIRPGETEPMEGVPYPSVQAYDTFPYAAVEDRPLEPKAASAETTAGHAGPPSGFELPTCEAMAPQPPHQVRNTGKTPIHYYRIEYKRIDGEGLKTHWREWYPWMATLTDAYRDHPYASNFH